MHRKSASESGFFHARVFLAFLFCLSGISLAVFSSARPAPDSLANTARGNNTGVGIPNALPTFGHPVISGIGGLGFEQAVRVDPTNPDRIYTSAPGTASADTS